MSRIEHVHSRKALCEDYHNTLPIKTTIRMWIGQGLFPKSSRDLSILNTIIVLLIDMVWMPTASSQSAALQSPQGTRLANPAAASLSHKK
jgi:hypothetical protein